LVDFCVYMRVSTDKQGITGLGMDAQREAVGRYVQNRGHIIGEFIEVESGKKHKNRPQLLAALAECRRRRAVLLIARLDRLARNVAFIANLMDSDVEFLAVDMPHANRLTIHILAAVAEHEREMISQRTKAALAAAKARGKKLGNPNYQEALARARAALGYKPPAAQTLDMMAHWRLSGETLARIADNLNAMDVRTPQGFRWYGSSVRAAILRYTDLPETPRATIPLIEGLQTKVGTLEQEKSDLVKRMEHLERQPAAPKGHVRAFSKTQDNGGASGETEIEFKARMAKLTPDQRNRELMKLAMSNPMELPNL
jgi:DNA invertase Pin-like site-specific DNA recombinase